MAIYIYINEITVQDTPKELSKDAHKRPSRTTSCPTRETGKNAPRKAPRHTKNKTSKKETTPNLRKQLLFRLQLPNKSKFYLWLHGSQISKMKNSTWKP